MLGFNLFFKNLLLSNVCASSVTSCYLRKMIVLRAIKRETLHQLHSDFHAGGVFKVHEFVYNLDIWIYYVDKTAVCSDLEVPTRIFIDVRRSKDAENLLLCWERGRTVCLDIVCATSFQYLLAGALQIKFLEAPQF